MKYNVTHKTKYSYSEAVPVCHNLVRLAPRSLPHQTCEDFRLLIHPEPVDFTNRTDLFGNHVTYFAIDQAHRGLTVTATSKVTVSAIATDTSKAKAAWDQLARRIHSDRSPEALDACQFVAASPCVKPLPELSDYAKASFQPDRPILDAVTDLTARIHADFTFDPRATTIQTPLQEVFEKRHGVCQDFAHLQIGCLRALGLAARYVSGYLRTIPPPGKARLVGVDASHAWVSVYCGEAGWIDIDPTNNVAASTDHVTVGWGRDYTDVCPIQGVIVGGGEHLMQVSVDVALEGESTASAS